MISLFNIKTVAHFESKTLLRSWFFRIFAALILVFIVLFNLFGLTTIAEGGWPGRYIPSGAPYFNIWILNVAQAIIAVFLSADFLGRDKKLDTTEAFYVRSMSNTEYVMGKTFGILKVFAILNVLVLLSGIIFSLIANEFTIPWLSYLIYPVLISIPTLVFVLGLSFFTMTLVRNQAITFVLLLGIIALSLFYLQNKWFGLTDFLGFYTPFMRSDFTGFGNLPELTCLRGAYFLLGLFFIVATIWRLPRLKQQKYQGLALSLGLIGLLTGSVVLLGLKIKDDIQASDLRSHVRQLNAKLLVSDYQIKTYNINLQHQHQSINCIAVMDVEKVAKAGHKLTFALNPGLEVSSCKVNNQNCQFNQDNHLIMLDLENSDNSNYKVELTYAGRVIDDAMFPEINDETWTSQNRKDPLLAGKQFSFIQSGYLMLTREANWYPVIASKQYWTRFPFTQMNLHVKTKNNLQVIAQGKRDSIAANEYKFSPEQSLNAYSLIIGDFERHTTTIDSVEFSLYHHKDHDFYKEYFTEINDTIADVIQSIKHDFERKIGLTYPFRRFALVEVPINMYSYLRNWSLTTENNMPEMVLFPENGGGNWQNDLSQIRERIERQTERSNEEKSDKEMQVEMLKNYLGNNFISPSRFFFGRRKDGERTIENWGRYQVFPNYFTYCNNIKEEGYPLLTIALENYLHQRLGETRRRGLGGLSSNDEVILKLHESSLSELIEKEDVNTLGNVFASKGSQLISNLKVNVDQSNFDKQLDYLVMKNRFVNKNVKEFSDEISKLTRIEFSDVYTNWLNELDKPAFLFGTVNVYEVKDGNRMRYFLKIPVTNKGNADGIISFTVREGQQRGRGGRFRSRFQTGIEQEDNKQSFLIKAGENNVIGFLLDEEPREVTVNTFLAVNIPSTQALQTNDVIRGQRRVDFFEGKQASSIKLNYQEMHEVIVDNEDEGFMVVNTGESRTVKDWWTSMQNEEENDSYGMLRFWNPPVKWKPVAGEQFFGEYLKSACYKRKGSGDGYVVWTGSIKTPGSYEVHAYVPVSRSRRRGRRSENEAAEYNFTIYHDDGEEPVLAKIDNDNDGWVYLGEFYFSEGKVKVQLSDVSNKEYIIADAVKWVKK